MDVWGWVITIGGGILLGLVIKWRYLDPEDRQHKILVRRCIDNQVKSRKASVKLRRGTPTLTVPYKSVSIELSLFENTNELTTEHTYARFRTSAFHDKHFKILLDSKDLFLKPLVVGTRVDVSDERFSNSFIVAGNEASFVTEVLTQEIRDKLLTNSFQVKFGRRTDSSTISRERGWLSVFTRGLLVSDEVFDGLIETAILFHDRLEVLNSRASLRVER